MKSTTRTTARALAVLLALPLAAAISTPALAGGANVPDGEINVFGPTAQNASENGEGNGHAYGRPAAGSAGRSAINPADTKSPLGQSLYASDKNQGYECDGNKGIGVTNPSHTSCSLPQD